MRMLTTKTAICNAAHESNSILISIQTFGRWLRKKKPATNEDDGIGTTAAATTMNSSW